MTGGEVDACVTGDFCPSDRCGMLPASKSQHDQLQRCSHLLIVVREVPHCGHCSRHHDAERASVAESSSLSSSEVAAVRTRTYVSDLMHGARQHSSTSTREYVPVHVRD